MENERMAIISGVSTRREVLAAAGRTGTAALLAGIGIPRAAARAAAPTVHHQPSAKHVIVLYMSGGYSHVDTFDPKPRLIREHDVSIGMEELVIAAGQPKVERFLKAPLWKFRPNAHCGTEVSDLFPHIRGIMHRAALVRSMQADHRDHGEATLQLHTGSTTVAMPSLGAWLSFGLGTFNPNLPSHVVISEHMPYGGTQPWDSNFLPSSHAGVRVVPGKEPIPDVSPAVPDTLQALELAYRHRLDSRHLGRSGGDQQLAGRTTSFGTAAGLQHAAPEALDLSRESAATLAAYGAEPGDTTSYAAQCIMARRLVERGVRFVEIIDTVGNCRDNWDAAHRDMKSHETYAKRVDQPVAALVEDLAGRGLLNDTLVVFCTEFGRTPWAQEGKGSASRNHHPEAFSCWLAGGGVRPGIVHGVTDDIGHQVAEDAVHIHDWHATILHIMGFDHTRLTFRNAGRDFRLTDVHGRVVRELLS